jgi:hypothetical protein
MIIITVPVQVAIAAGAAGDVVTHRLGCAVGDEDAATCGEGRCLVVWMYAY